MDPRTRLLLEAPIGRTILRLSLPNIAVMAIQAAIGLVETYFIAKLGTDALAGLALVFPVGPVTVQVKTGTKRPNRDGSISVPTTPEWREKWRHAKTPVYLIYVRLEKTPPAHWIEHAELRTTVHARAHWVRVNSLSVATVKVPVSNRLTAATLDGWVDDFERAFGKAATA